ncbi:prolipoprotein diacylglyceryl transferase [Brevundimonas sp. Root1279]|uniref:prolipoprotein diacylglyceryl transferase n=1 Tax=Brevundimonas sp. Root1279 TaxID=1736443 RepID=UPI0006F2389D|nr:prolipoprotein diacylglyceryl transferase [Brevundimonas sp. Root1279]KQW80859.1 prolipoprotein diacylglyceryl transferase [Brevundimonas sp. Root1279]
MPFPEFDPVLFSIGPLDIRWYALAYVAGIVLGWWYASRLAKNIAVWAPGKPPVTSLQLDDLVLWITLGIIGGGRLGYALFYKPSLYAQIFTGPEMGDRLALFRLWDGGMSFHGGLIGVTLAIVWFAWKHKIRLLSLGDLVAPVVPIGLFFGRIANFINGELWGRPTDAPWGMVFCNSHIAKLYGGGCPPELLIPRHPSQLYEAALEGALLAVILWLAVFKGRLLAKPGYVTGIFLLGYGLVRASLENVRQPDAGKLSELPFGLTMGMMLSVPMMIIGAWLIWRAWKRPPVEATA